MRPGDSAPGGGTFDASTNGWINETGYVAFGAHVAGEECIDVGSPFVCGESVYLKDAATGVIKSIAHQGDPAPRGGFYRLAFEPVVNNQDEIVFIGDLTPPPDVVKALGVFLASKGSTIAVARPGDRMPGGGNFVTASSSDSNYQKSETRGQRLLGAGGVDIGHGDLLAGRPTAAGDEGVQVRV